MLVVVNNCCAWAAFTKKKIIETKKEKNGFIQSN
jgi:hypothetical protein